MKKNLGYIILGIIIIAVVAGIIFATTNKNKEGIKLETTGEIKKMFETIYSNLGDQLPSLETEVIDVNDELQVKAFTGLQTNENVDALVVSEPLINAQAYSAVVVKAKEGANIEAMKKEMLENINMNKWICVSAEKAYITNSGNIIFLVMSDEDWAKSVYEEFKKFTNNQIGKELEKTESFDDVELPPEMPIV